MKINKKILIIGIILFIGIFVFIRIIGFYFDNKNINYKNIWEGFENENTKIIIPDIIGGLGNQLFVVASAFAFSKDNNYKLMLDNRKDVSSYGKPRPTYNETVFYKIPITDIDKTNFKNLNENEFSSNNENKNIFLTGGYYQEAKYFDKYRNDIINLFESTQQTKDKINEIYKTNNIDTTKDYLISIHIRLDDVYTPIDADKRVYDEDEYETIRKKIPELIKKKNNTKFIIFSNDIPRTKDIFKNVSIDASRIIYISSEDYVELAIMSQCDEYIASPSTFNWWGIYLNDRNKKIHIYWKQDTDYRKDFYKKYEYLMNNKNNGKTIEKFNNNNNNKITNNFTCVSGYWNVNNKHGNKFNDWFENTLAINCPYVFFTNNENIEKIKKFRKNYPTHFITKDITNFKTYKLNMKNETDKKHVPSKELGLIWLEKMNLVKEAADLNPYNSEWFCWIDAGICVFRNENPPSAHFPNPNKINLLSKTQINYSTSDNISYEELSKVKKWEYVHNISGTSFILHISMINKFYDLFYKYLNKCISDTKTFLCYSDQCIWTRIFVDYPELFNKVGNGYGQIIKEII